MDVNDIAVLLKDSVAELILVSGGDIAGRKEIDLNALSTKEFTDFLSKYILR